MWRPVFILLSHPPQTQQHRARCGEAQDRQHIAIYLTTFGLEKLLSAEEATFKFEKEVHLAE